MIEVMIVVLIVAVLVSVILANINQSRKKARVNGAKTSLKLVLPAIMACKDGGGNVSLPPTADADICATAVGLTGATWPTLPDGYAYVPGLGYNSVNCSFTVFTNGDSADLTCGCEAQICQ